jgi:hypothetical protein
MESFLALTVPFIFVIVLIWIKSDEKRKRNQLQAELFVKALEKGQSIPADLFADMKEPQKKRNPFNIGIIWTAVGIGISLFFVVIALSIAQTYEEASVVFRSFAAAGIIPFLIGIAFVIIHFIEKKKSVKEHA